ncbi:caspase-3-like isoform X3 [Ornithodoros turicata]|uniref:caspase-3-like isoform X3 n=1 Tax=Ornithodoros turicata TaxID=34597 RepID=UPI003138ED23
MERALPSDGFAAIELLYKSSEKACDFSWNSVPWPLASEFIKKKADGDGRSSEYSVDGSRGGTCLIINIARIKDASSDASVSNQREGSTRDVDRIHGTFDRLGFQVSCHPDPPASQIISILEEEVNKSEEDLGCFVCWIMTHGVNGAIKGADGQEINLNRLPGILNTPSLKGKPKLFFIQACQADETETSTRHWGCNIPTYPDFLFSFATTPGYMAWRSTEKGSIYVEAICNAFEKSFNAVDKMDVTEVLNSAARQVAIEFETQSSDAQFTGCKQALCYFSTLTQSLYLTPPNQSA